MSKPWRNPLSRLAIKTPTATELTPPSYLLIAEPQHRDDPESRPGREEREGPPPAERRLEHRHEPDRHDRERESQRKLQRKCRPHVSLVGVLGHDRRELRRVPHYRDAPDDSDG